MNHATNGMPANNYYRAMMKSILTIGFFLPVIPMTLVCGVMFYQFHFAYTRQVNVDFAGIVQIQRQLIDDLLRSGSGSRRFLAEPADFNSYKNTPDLKRAIDATRATGASVYIINNTGQILMKTDSVGIDGKKLVERWSKNNKDPEKTSFIVFRQTDSSGKKTLYGMAQLSYGDAFLVYGIRVSKLFSPLWRAKIITVILFVVIVLGLAVNAYRLSKKMVSRMEAADKEKEKLNEQMYQTKKLASIGELALGVAHEINNPVAIMVEEAGWIGDLLEDEELKSSKNRDEIRRALKQIKTQGMRCRDISYKLLSFARKTGTKAQSIQIPKLIEDSIEAAVKTSDKKPVVIDKNIQKDLPMLSAPHTELQQVLVNLIDNALDAMENRKGILSVSARLENSRIVIEVTDNGSGISPENQAKIFDPFFTTKSVGEGTGLGLSICYGIVKELGGEITVNSEAGKGSTFRVMLPV